jgi:predicted nucleic acid-binding protein
MSGFLLDTNVPSELSRPRPDAVVAAWLEAQIDDQLFISVVTLGEISERIHNPPRPQAACFP